MNIIEKRIFFFEIVTINFLQLKKLTGLFRKKKMNYSLHVLFISIILKEKQLKFLIKIQGLIDELISIINSYYFENNNEK